MFNFDYVTNKDIKDNNPKWTEILDYPYRVLIIGISGSRKTNALLNLRNTGPDIDKKFIYMLKIYLRQNINCKLTNGNVQGNDKIKYFSDSKTFIEYLIDMDDTYKNIE